MPLTRYQIRNEYGLADPELYRAADKDDPEALLEGVAMAGLVGILRQLGDLAEFAAEMFHDLHEEVMATAARGHGLMVRVQQLEAEFPSIEKALLSRTDHSPFFSNTGVDWRPNLQMEQSLITRGDLPRCIMGSYEECRGPPRLFLLDKFDVAGAGACLKRYTDPSFFRLETSSSEASIGEIQREKKSRKAKKRGSRWRNGGTPEIAPTSHAKLHQLFLEERVEGGHADPARLVKLKTRKLDGYSLVSKSGESYMEKFVRTSPDHKTGYENSASYPQLLMWNMDDTRDSVTEIPEISMVGVVEKSCRGAETDVSSPNKQENVPKLNLNGDIIDRDIETVPESTPCDEAEKSTIPDRIVEKDLRTNLKGMSEFLQDRSYSEDVTSEVDNYVDALATMESDTETENGSRPRNISGFLNVGKHDTDSDADKELMENPPRLSDSQSIGHTSASENGCSLSGKWRSSFSFSDTASVSTENDPPDREKTAGHAPSNGICENEPMAFSSNVIPANKDTQGFDSHEPESVSGSDVDVQASCSSHGTSSSAISLSQNNESCSPMVQSLAPESMETLNSARFDPKKGATDEGGTNLVDSSTSGARLDVRDPSFSSEASSGEPSVPASEGNKCVTAIDDAIQTNYATDFCSENLANPEIGSKLSDDTPTGEQFPSSAGPETEVSPDGTVFKVGSPITAAEIHSKNTLYDETDNVIVTKAVPEVDSQIPVAELSSESSPAFGITADESVSETHRDTLENRTLMRTEVVEGTLASEVSFEDKKLISVASPNHSVHGKRLLDTSPECHSSYLDSEGFDGLVSLEHVAPETVPEEEVACEDVNCGVSLSPSSISSPSSVLNDTHQTSSGAGELCQKVLESDGKLLVEYNPESETKMVTNQLEVSSEVFDSMLSETAPDVPLNVEVSDNVRHSSPVVPKNNDLANGESRLLQTSLGQSDTEPETKSPHQSNLSNNYVDSPVLDVWNLSESETPLEQSIEVKAPQPNHVLTDEAILESDVCQGLYSELAPESAGFEPNSSLQALNLESTFPSLVLIPEAAQPALEGMPPLPPLPPMQWRIGKVQHSIPASPEESVENSRNSKFRFAALDQDSVQPEEQSRHQISLEGGKSGQLPDELVNNADKPSLSPTNFPSTVTGLSAQYESSGSERAQSVNPSVTSPTMSDQGLKQDFGSEEGDSVQSTSTLSSLDPSAMHATESHDLDSSSREMSSQPQNQSAADEDPKDEVLEHISQTSGDSHHCPDNNALMLTLLKNVEEKHQSVPQGSDGEAAEPSNSSLQKILPGTVGDAMWPAKAFALAPTLDAEKPNEVPMVKLPRPRSPLVDAVAAHDRRTMRKVSERVRPPTEPKEEEKNSFLAQIRNKSFSLKPAVTTRPSVQVGPKTNLKVAAILEKANTIRQAMAGSDEDDDSDSWSDS